MQRAKEELTKKSFEVTDYHKLLNEGWVRIDSEVFLVPEGLEQYDYQPLDHSNIPSVRGLLSKDEALDLLASPNYFKKSRDNSVIGKLKGIYFVPNATSRNGRYYTLELWQSVLKDESFLSRLRRGLLGTLEHPKVVEQYTKEGLHTGSHSMFAGFSTTDLVIDTIGGTPYGIGTSYILDTPMGRTLDVLFRARDENGRPVVKLFPSSRAWGKYIGQRPDGSNIMSPTNYYLKTFDMVNEPGFLIDSIGYSQFKESVDDPFTEILDDVIKICKDGSCKIYKFSNTTSSLNNYIPQSKFLKSRINN